jgi:hypothetical protein
MYEIETVKNFKEEFLKRKKFLEEEISRFKKELDEINKALAREETNVGASLWTSPSYSTLPLEVASIDSSVSKEQIKDTVDAVKDRIATFSGKVTLNIYGCACECPKCIGDRCGRYGT